MDNEEAVELSASTTLLIETLEKRWKTYRSELKRCHKEPSEEAIHDLRSATRRLLTLVDMLRELSPHPRLHKLHQIIKHQLEGLDDLRDTQVMLVEVTEALSELPELNAFQDYLFKREKRLLHSTMKAIKAFKSAGVRKRLDTARKALFEIKDSRNQHELLLIVDEAFETVLRRFRRVEPLQPATIHRLRVAFKKFRYQIEIVHLLITSYPDSMLKDMHNYQGLMGDIRDLEIFISSFEDFADNDSLYNPEHVNEVYKQRYVEVISTFIEEMQQVNTFWRPTPESPFPWEAGHSMNPSTLPAKSVK
jgi:CHAD domain-containing protein